MGGSPETHLPAHSTWHNNSLAPGPLEVPGGGVPFVLKRTDGGGPEWVKRDHHHDFMLDLTDVSCRF